MGNRLHGILRYNVLLTAMYGKRHCKGFNRNDCVIDHLRPVHSRTHLIGIRSSTSGYLPQTITHHSCVWFRVQTLAHLHSCNIRPNICTAYLPVTWVLNLENTRAGGVESGRPVRSEAVKAWTHPYSVRRESCAVVHQTVMHNWQQVYVMAVWVCHANMSRLWKFLDRGIQRKEDVNNTIRPFTNRDNRKDKTPLLRMTGRELITNRGGARGGGCMLGGLWLNTDWDMVTTESS